MAVDLDKSIKMKKSNIALVFGLLLLPIVPLQAFDGTINIGAGPGQTGSGGPFKITINNSPAPSAALQAIANASNPFLSFCIEKTEHINLDNNQAYKVTVSPTHTAELGGIGGPSDPISLATAWIYSQFRWGSITDGAAAQQAIWYLEQEQEWVDTSATGKGLVNAAIAALTEITDINDARTVNAGGAFGVRVLNVYGADGITMRQDQLAMVPEPSTYVAGALLLLPVLAQLRRWRRSA